MDKKKRITNSKFRLIVQVIFAALSNGYLKGFFKGKIYQGKLKNICVPGMNCYSCPGAIGACPIGSLQASLTTREFGALIYVVGCVFLVGTVLGRAVCGFLCPFGLIQDLLFKIPFVRKIKSLPGEKHIRFFKYFVLSLFVIIMPLFFIDITGIGKPWFCKFICPVGTLEGGIPLIILNKFLRSSVGFLYAWKIIILAFILIFSIIIYRPFCRYICPLGAIYGIFNKFSLIRYKIDSAKCIKCGKCQKACHFDIKVWANPNGIDCIRCGKCREICPENAIDLVSFFKLKKTVDK